jgi:hypothetical protein
MDNKPQAPKVIEGQCPSCGYVGNFRHIGSQNWPEEVAANLGVPTRIELYQCENCLTTISEPSLQRDS